MTQNLQSKNTIIYSNLDIQLLHEYLPYILNFLNFNQFPRKHYSKKSLVPLSLISTFFRNHYPYQSQENLINIISLFKMVIPKISILELYRISYILLNEQPQPLTQEKCLQLHEQQKSLKSISLQEKITLNTNLNFLK